MTYLDWLSGRTERGRRRTRRRSSSKNSQRLARARDLITLANNLYVRNDFQRCIDVLKEVVCLTPKNPHPYFTLGLIFEEKQDLVKAYYCFLISAHLQRSNYGLWKRLYDYSRRLGYERERIYFIEVLQKKSNRREMVVEKMALYGDDRLKELCCRVELFEFDGPDDTIFEAVRERVGHRTRVGRVSRRLCSYLTKNPDACSDYYVQQLILMKYEAHDFADLKNVFDRFFFPRQMELTSRMWVIYIVASVCDSKGDVFANADCCNVSRFLCSDAWMSLDDVDLARHLADILIDRGRSEDAVELLGRMEDRFEGQGEFVHWKLGRIFQETGRYGEALLHYNLVLRTNPINDVVKSHIHSIYTAQGNAEMARKYETISQLVSIVDGLDRNRGRTYTPEMCMDMRILYENSSRLLEGGNLQEFVRANDVLVNDFLKNRFMFERKKPRSRSIVRVDENVPVRDTQRFRFVDLHGLDVDEWFFALTGQIFSLLALHRVEDATSLLFRLLEAHVFRGRSNLMAKLVFVGLKISLVFGEFTDFVVLARTMMIHTGNFSYAYLLFYFANFFLGFHKNSGFSSCQKYLQRVCRRRVACHEESSGDEEDQGVRHRGSGVTRFLYLNSLLPNMLQAKTVESLSADGERSFSEATLLASMFLVHSKSRRVSDRSLFIKKGVAILKNLRARMSGEEAFAAAYNMGKAYHFFGFLGFAETFYLEALGSSDEELRRLALFNLYLIYRKNNTLQLFSRIV